MRSSPTSGVRRTLGITARRLVLAMALAVVAAIVFATSGCGDASPDSQSTPLLLAPSPGLSVNDAGLVIAAPFIPVLFDRADLHLSRFDPARGESPGPEYYRAMLLLDYLLDGSTTFSQPPSGLVKVLCGLPVDLEPPPEMHLRDDEIQLCDSLLRVILANWTIVGGTSSAGLRETFLQREGILDREGEWYRLRVQRKTVDVLVDQIPWSFSVLYFPWMAAPLYTTW
jgi:hypothetical protein